MELDLNLRVRVDELETALKAKVMTLLGVSTGTGRANPPLKPGFRSLSNCPNLERQSQKTANKQQAVAH